MWLKPELFGKSHPLGKKRYGPLLIAKTVLRNHFFYFPCKATIL